MYSSKVILITGGTGSWGQILTKKLLSYDVEEIRILSRNELNQFEMKKNFNNEKIKFIIGDVRDLHALNCAMSGVDYVFHLAALKHVPICEEQPIEAINTNIIGTENIVKAAIYNKVEKVIYVSTDKAVSPYNLYGMTKAIGEKIVINGNINSESTRFVCIRAGNVMGSNGSVIPFFIEQIKKYNKVSITDINMTRYFMTINEAIDLLIMASQESLGGEILVMNMPACKIIDLAKILIKQYGDESTRIEEIGIRPGEKLHEELVSKYEAPNTYKLSEEYYLILPTIEIKELNNYYDNFQLYEKVSFKVFDSSLNLMNEKQILERLKLGNFIR